MAKANKKENYLQYEKKEILESIHKIRNRLDKKRKEELANEAPKEETVFSMVRSVFSFALKKSKKETMKYVSSKVAESVFKGAGPYSGKLLYGSLGNLILKSANAINFWSTASFVALEAIRGRLQHFYVTKGKLHEKVLTDKYKDTMTSNLFGDLLRNKSRPYFKKNDSASLFTNINSIASSKASLLTSSVNLGSEILVFCMATGSMMLVSPKLAGAVLGVTIVADRFEKYMNARLRKSKSRAQTWSNKMGSENRDSVTNATLVQEVTKVDEESRRIKIRQSRMSGVSQKINKAQMFSSLKFRSAIILGMQAIISVAAIVEVIETKDIGRFALINNAAWQALNAGIGLSMYYSEMQKIAHQVIDTEKKLKTPKALEREIGRKNLDENDTKISVRNVSFAYPRFDAVTNIDINKEEGDTIERGKSALKNISVDFDKGQLTSVIGESGGGKSTLVNLIRHDYDVESGEIYIGDKEIRTVSDEELNGQISFVDQNVQFFNQSIKYNLRYYNENATDEEIWEVLEKVCLKDTILEKFEKGLDHNIGFAGKELSGGQRQRLALARAILCDKPIVIMDEPTTGLDPETSYSLMNTIKELSKEKTIILVTHNPAEIALSDRVVMIDKGRLIADGSPLELVEKGCLDSVLTKKGIESYEELYDGVRKKLKERELIENIFDSEEEKPLSDEALQEKRKFLEEKRDKYIHTRKIQILSQKTMRKKKNGR